jgi:hypothetical protein
MESLHARSGVTRDLKRFAFDIREIAATQPLPARVWRRSNTAKAGASWSLSTATRISRVDRRADGG